MREHLVWSDYREANASPDAPVLGAALKQFTFIRFDREPPSTNAQLDAGHVRRIVGGQEYRGRADVVRQTDLPIGIVA
jgi:hypothetical protein